MSKKLPPAHTGVPVPVHARSIYEPQCTPAGGSLPAKPVEFGSLPDPTAVEPMVRPQPAIAEGPTPAQAGRQPFALIQAPPSVLDEPTTSDPAPPPPVTAPRKSPIAFVPSPRRRAAATHEVYLRNPMTIVPEDPNEPKRLDTACVAPLPRVVIGVFREMTDEERKLAAPTRVGANVPVLFVQGLGYVRYAGTYAVVVNAVMDYGGVRTVYVSVLYSKGTIPGEMRRKFRMKKGERRRQLEGAVARAFSDVEPCEGIALLITAGPPTMTDGDMAVVAYPPRRNSKDVPVRGEFSTAFIEQKDAELKAIAESMRRRFFVWRLSILLFWWIFSRTRLAEYRASELLIQAEAAGQKSVLLAAAKEALKDEKHRKAVEAAAAVDAVGPAGSLARLLWKTEEGRAALIERGIRVELIPGTCLGTVLGEGE